MFEEDGDASSANILGYSIRATGPVGNKSDGEITIRLYDQGCTQMMLETDDDENITIRFYGDTEGDTLLHCLKRFVAVLEKAGYSSTRAEEGNPSYEEAFERHAAYRKANPPQKGRLIRY